MPLLDITNPDVIKFLVESYDKTARLRMKWNNVHASKLKEAATLQREEKGYFELDVIEKAMAAGMPTVTRDYAVSTRTRKRKPIRDGVHIPGISELRKGHSIVDIGLGDPKEDPRLTRPDTDLTLNPVMRPIDPELREIIYKDKPVYGREVYLKKRAKIAPETKYYFQACGGWEYGWRLKDSYFSKNMTQFGRVWRLTHDLKVRSGPQPDPEHYKSSEAPGVSKCT